MGVNISEFEYARIRSMLYDSAGINIGENKQMLVMSRLAKRLRHHNLSGFKHYLELLESRDYPDEWQIFIDLLTTNETYFFREPVHYDFLKDTIIPDYKGKHAFRIWSAASSTGEEAYSIAMILADKLGGRPWEVMGTDINKQVLKTATKGQYSLQRTEGIPADYLTKFCLRGVGPEYGTLLIEQGIRDYVKFQQANLNKSLPSLGMFDVVFLRNVLIYFDKQTKLSVLERVLEKLRPGGFLFTGSAEPLSSFEHSLKQVSTSIYQLPHDAFTENRDLSASG